MIQEENIQFLASQRLEDVPEGGGAATGKTIPDGVLNNVFEDISDLDRAYGRLNLRKLFLGVRSLDTDLYGGAKLVVTQLPADDALGYTLFTTDDPFDTRAEAAGRVEAYLYKGPAWNGYLFDNHIEGMRAIKIFAREGAPTPPIGKTLCLVGYEGEAGEVEQYVRVTQVDSTTQTWGHGDDAYSRAVITLTLSDALRHDFAGHTPNKDDVYTYLQGKARLRDTTVADATNYYSAKPLSVAGAVGDLQIRAESLFTALVPSTQTERPLYSQPMAGTVAVSLACGNGHTVEVTQTPHTLARAVTVENRRQNWIETLVPIPAPGSLSVAFRARGNWYELIDQGNGTLTGNDAGIGAGTVNYETGLATITTAALPDAGSQIFWTWASPVHYAVRAGETADVSNSLAVSVALPQTPYQPGSLVVGFTRGGLPVSVPVPSSFVSGSGVSVGVNASTGNVNLSFTALPDRGTALTLDWRYLSPDDPQTPAEHRLTATLNSARVVDFGAAVQAGAVTLLAPWAMSGQTQTLRITDNGSGALVSSGRTVGSIDYALGVATLSGAVPESVPVFKPAWMPDGQHYSGGEWVTESVDRYAQIGGTVYAIVATGAAATGTQAPTLTLDLGEGALKCSLTATSTDEVVPGSARFLLGGKLYQDRGTGILYTDVDPATGSGLVAGSLDYDSGVIVLTDWQNGASAPPEVLSCLTRFGDWTAATACFRTGLSPLKPEALSIQVTGADGTQINASADAAGAFVGAHVRGSVNYEFGTAALEFGDTVDGAWAPRAVDPATLRYNAVAYSYLPLDADILGIDPVRLPSDGRVPIYRAGDVVLILHSQETAPQTVALNGAIACGRTRLAWVRVIDADGATVLGTHYALDRAAGVVTLTDLTGLTQPLTVRHTVADLRQITDAQINGQLTLSRPLTHAFPAGETLVASCLIIGDRRARVSAAFDQAAWTTEGWKDSLSGPEATATLNLIDFPITVTNEGADTDRWLFRCTNAATHQWELISEKRGLVWSGTYAPYTGGVPADVAPINPRTRTLLEDGVTYAGGVPYLTLPQRAGGGGWSTGNLVRINTVGAIADFWIARSIQQSEEPADPAAADGCEIYALGNVDRP